MKQDIGNPISADNVSQLEIAIPSKFGVKNRTDQ